MDPWIMRLVIGAIGAIVLIAIYLHGRRGAQGQRRASSGSARPTERIEPGVGAIAPLGESAEDPHLQAELARLAAEIGRERSEPTEHAEQNEQPAAGRRAIEDASRRLRAPVGGRDDGAPIDRIITLYVMAAEGAVFNGADVLVAAEKAGLEYGALGIFHRLRDGRPEQGPVFSMANMREPGSFDLKNVHAIATPGLALFMTLPGPLPALDAWDTLLPTAQRLAELLGGEVLDEDRNTLARQRVQFMRDELRAYDRAREKNTIRRPW